MPTGGRLKKMEITLDRKLFNPAYLPFVNDDTRNQIFYGGSSSGKSKFIAQRLVMDLLSGRRNYLCTRKVAKTLRKSSFAEVTKVINEWKLTKTFTVNQSDMLITCNNGYQSVFVGLDDVEKVKSITPAKGVFTDTWEEEATENEEVDDKQLGKRLRGQSKVVKRRTKSFNPILQDHWIFKQYFGGWQDDKNELRADDLLILKTTYKDNQFLELDDIKELENETDKYYYDVYTLGNWGILGGVIFRNWTVEDFDRKHFDNYKAGVDFGYGDDPAAIILCHLDRMRKIIYICGESYQTGLTNDLLSAEIRRVCDRTLVTCDSAEPKSIQELRNLGISATAAIKGKDSVNMGIQWIQQHQIIIHPTCTQFLNEFRAYKREQDKTTGAILPNPVDKNNHGIDALRYALEIDMQFVRQVKRDRPGPKRGAI